MNRCTVSAVSMTMTSCKDVYLIASMSWRCGCFPINRLQLDVPKTEVLWCSSVLCQHQIPIAPITIGSTTVTPVRAVRDLGIYIDGGLTVQARVVKTVSSCFAVLRRLRIIHQLVTKPVLQSLVVSVILTCLDYGSATPAGLSNVLLDRLLSVLHAAALIYSAH